MSLLVDIREVPWRILELVQARILANRESKARRQQVSDVRKHTRPRPQQRRMGATMSTYREPEPVPLVLDELDKIAFAVVQETTSGNDSIVTVSNRGGTQSVTLTIPQLVKEYPQSEWFGGEEGYDVTYTGEDFQLGINGLWWLTPVFPGLDTSAKVYTTTTRTQLKRDVTQGSHASLIVMPCGSEAAVVVYRYDAIACTAVLKITSTNTDTRILTATYTYTSVSGQPETWALLGRQSQGSSTVQTLTNAQTRCIYRAVYVSPQTVKEVPVPAVLRNEIARICPEPTQLGTAVSAPIYTGQFGSSYYNPPDTIIETGEQWPNGDPVLAPGSAGDSYYPSYTNITVNTPRIGASVSYAASNAQALVGWGLYRPSQQEHATPGIFAFFKSYDPLTATGEEETSYSYAKSQYLQSAPVPNRFLGECVLADSCDLPSGEPGTIRFDRTSVIPDNTGTDIPVQSFRPGTRKYGLTVGEGSTYLAAWDWGRAAYCRQQLLALGFTEADLTP